MIPPKVTRPMAAVAQDWRAGRYPWQLVVAAVCWVVVAVSLITSRIGVPDPTDAATEADSLNGVTPVISTNAQDHWFAPVLPWVGVLMVLVTVALLLAQGWARMVLAGLGLLGVVGLGLVAQWQFFPALIGFLAGAVFGLLLRTHRYLLGQHGDAPPAEPEHERTVMP
jgi:hypothetical protein